MSPQAFPCGAWWKTKRQQAPVEIREVRTGCREKLFQPEAGWPGRATHCPERLCSLNP